MTYNSFHTIQNFVTKLQTLSVFVICYNAFETKPHFVQSPYCKELMRQIRTYEVNTGRTYLQRLELFQSKFSETLGSISYIILC